MSIFHFQYLGQVGWEPIGAGLGDGDTAVPMALEEVREMAGGELPTGSYRVIAARAADPRWEAFELGRDGLLIDAGDGEESVGGVIGKGRRARAQARATCARSRRLRSELPRSRAATGKSL